MTVYMYIATTAWFSLAYGYIRRFNRRSHVPFMVAGILMDILLVLYLEVTRQAIETAIGFTLKPLQQIHILFSSIALICYFPTLYFGFKLIRGEGGGRTKRMHKLVANTALIFRTLGFFFMFSMLDK